MLKRFIGMMPCSLNFHDKFCLPEKECSNDIELTYGFIKLIFSSPPTLKDQFENGNPFDK